MLVITKVQSKNDQATSSKTVKATLGPLQKIRFRVCLIFMFVTTNLLFERK